MIILIRFQQRNGMLFHSDEQQKILLQYRLTYLAETEVNWCPGLGTVLANDEIVNGVSERGGYPVIRKKMTQWSYANFGLCRAFITRIGYHRLERKH